MSLPKTENRLKEKFLKVLVSRYIEIHGNSYANLSEHHFWVIDTFHPELPEFRVEVGETYEYLTSLYVNELISEGFAELNKKNSNQFHLTKSGFDKAIELKHPWRTFHKKHYQWLYGILLTILGIIVAVVYQN